MAIKSLKSNSYGRSVMAGNSLILPGDFESIATTTLSSSGTVTFSSIPQTFKHLQIRINARDVSGFSDCILQMRFNSDTGGNYGYHWLYGNGASVSAYQFTANSVLSAGYLGGGGAAANIFGSAVIDIFDYSNTNKYKTTRSLVGIDRNGSGWMGLFSGYWASTSGISTILLQSDNGSFGANSSFALYGIRG